MNTSAITDMLQKDAIAASYGVVSSTIRKTTSKVLGDKGIGKLGVDALSLAAGIGLSQTNNTHLKIIGSALRISGIAHLGNTVIEKLVSRKTEEK